MQRHATAQVAKIPLHIAQRELQGVSKSLGWTQEMLTAKAIENSRGPGNVLCIEIQSENLTEVFTGFGERGTPWAPPEPD